MTAEILYWWRVTSQIWGVLLIGLSKFSSLKHQREWNRESLHLYLSSQYTKAFTSTKAKSISKHLAERDYASRKKANSIFFTSYSWKRIIHDNSLFLCYCSVCWYSGVLVASKGLLLPTGIHKVAYEQARLTNCLFLAPFLALAAPPPKVSPNSHKSTLKQNIYLRL